MKKQNTIVLDLDLRTNMIFAARFSFNPLMCIDFSCSRIKYDTIEAILPVLHKVMTWRSYNYNSVILFPHSLINADWTALFCNYAKKTEDGLVFSMCGPIEDWKLFPVDPKIKPYTITNNITERMKEHIMEIKVVEKIGIPHPDSWDWKSISTVAFLHNIGNHNIKQTIDGPDVVVF